MTRIDDAFQAINRAEFLPTERKDDAFVDAPIPIGFGQTNSQHSTVRKMLEWLNPQPGDKILDVGSGSGWTTALLSHIVGPYGTVYAIEMVPELVEFGKKNCERLGISNVHFFHAAQTFGMPKYAPFDRILVSATADLLPFSLISQIKICGKIVIPIQNNILEITKNSKLLYDTVEHPNFFFVPLFHAHN